MIFFPSSALRRRGTSIETSKAGWRNLARAAAAKDAGRAQSDGRRDKSGSAGQVRPAAILIHPDVGKELLSVDLGGADLSGLSVDEPIPDHLIPEKTKASMSRLQTAGGAAQQEKLSVRELYERYAGSRGSYSVVGTPSYVADQMEEWLTTEAADGFIIQASYLPGGS